MPAVAQFPNPVRVGKGYALPFSLDWSMPAACPSPFMVDFFTQPYANEFGPLESMWIDNSNSTNDIIVTVLGMLQTFRVYAGEIKIVPCFSLDTPQVTFANQNNGTPNTGLVNILLFNFNAGIGQVISSLSQGMAVIQPPTQQTPNIVQTALTSATTKLLNNGQVTKLWYIQNTGTGQIYVAFASGAPPTVTIANGITIPANGAIWSDQFAYLLTSAIYASCTAAGNITVTWL